ncbi:MAG: universal stress protein [Bacteroidetes bacterium]|nr:MAG: universal stress protein [Bacteroidota bacterium]
MLHLNHILVAYDYSAFANKALARALRLARVFEAELHVLYADVLFTTPHDETLPTHRGMPLEAVRAHLQETVERIAGELDIPLADLAVTYAVDRDVAAAPAILTYAEDHPIDLIVVGTHGRRGVPRLLLGSVAEEVVRAAPCPVLTVHGNEPDDARPIRRILVPIDFSRHARQALAHAKEMAHLLEAQLILQHVIQEQLHPAFYNTGIFSIYDVEPDIEDRARAELQRFYDETDGPAAPPERAPRFVVGPGHPAHEIITLAEEEQVDLIVMATHGRSGLERFLMGSVAERVVRRAPCSVFTVKSFGRSLLSRPDQAAAEASS